MDTHEELLPPWKKYPQIPLGSLGWRMGFGEEYWIAWQKWYAELSPPPRSQYQTAFPEPPGWSGFYGRAAS